MAVPLVATVGGADSNSLATVAGADAYFSLDIRADEWASIDEDDKARALISASRQFSELDLMGQPYSVDQAMPFPRYLLGVSDGTTIPTEWEIATFEHAFDLYARQSATSGASGKRARLRAEGVTSYRLGDLSESLAPVSSQTTVGGSLAQFSGRVQRLIDGWVRKTMQFDSGRHATFKRWWPPELNP